MPFVSGLYYFIHQPDYHSRPPALLIHGAGGTHLNWPPQVRRLDDQRVLALDLPGHGKSGGIGRQLISDYAADVLTFMDALKLPVAVLVGHSMGSGIVLQIAAEHPGRVLGLVLLGASAHLQVSPRLLQAASDPSTYPEAVRMVTEYSYGPQADPRMKELGGQRMLETRHAVFYSDLRACDAFNISGALSRIAAPALILAAERDRMTPVKLSEMLHRDIPGSRLHFFPGAGHMLMLEQPEKVAALLSGFLEEFPDRPG